MFGHYHKTFYTRAVLQFSDEVVQEIPLFCVGGSMFARLSFTDGRYMFGQFYAPDLDADCAPVEIAQPVLVDDVQVPDYVVFDLKRTGSSKKFCCWMFS